MKDVIIAYVLLITWICFLGCLFWFGTKRPIEKENTDSQFWKERYEQVSAMFLELQSQQNKIDLVQKKDGKYFRCYEMKQMEFKK